MQTDEKSTANLNVAFSSLSLEAESKMEKVKFVGFENELARLR